MQAIEFEAIPWNGVVPIPARYRDWEGRKVKVIFLAEEDDTRQVVLSWRDRMSVMPTLKTTVEQLLEPVADGWEPYL